MRLFSSVLVQCPQDVAGNVCGEATVGEGLGYSVQSRALCGTGGRVTHEFSEGLGHRLDPSEMRHELRDDPPQTTPFGQQIREGKGASSHQPATHKMP